MRKQAEAPDVSPGIRDRSELSSLYPTVQPINTNPISTPQEIEERKRRAVEKQIRQLRRESVKIGFYIAIPYLIGLFAIQQVVLRIPYLDPDDIGGAMFIVFTAFFTTSLSIFTAYFLFRRAGDIFGNHYLKAWPVVIGIISAMVGTTQWALEVTDGIENEFLNYATSLSIIAAVSIVISSFLIFIWTTKIPQPTKLLILAGIIIISFILLFL